MHRLRGPQVWEQIYQHAATGQKALSSFKFEEVIVPEDPREEDCGHGETRPRQVPDTQRCAVLAASWREVFVMKEQEASSALQDCSLGQHHPVEIRPVYGIKTFLVMSKNKRKQVKKRETDEINFNDLFNWTHYVQNIISTSTQDKTLTMRFFFFLVSSLHSPMCIVTMQHIPVGLAALQVWLGCHLDRTLWHVTCFLICWPYQFL